MVPSSLKKSGFRVVYEDFKYPTGSFNSSGQLPSKIISLQDKTFEKWRNRTGGKNYDGFIEECVIAIAEELVKNA